MDQDVGYGQVAVIMLAILNFGGKEKLLQDTDLLMNRRMEVSLH